MSHDHCYNYIFLKEKKKSLENFNNFNYFITKTSKIILKNLIIFIINFDIFEIEKVYTFKFKFDCLIT